MNEVKIDTAVDPSDAEIIEKVLNGHTHLYEIIMRRYNQRLYRIGRAFFKNNDAEIEDVMQFTYIRGFEKLSTFEQRASISTWLTRIFINEALARKRYQSKFSEMPDNDQSALNMLIETRDMKTPIAVTINNELKELLEQSINELPEKYRLVFVMFEVEKLNIRETAECLNISESNVKVRLNRARKMLRDKLSSFYKSDEIFSFNAVRCDVIVSNVLRRISG